jgi:hypothetical protein
VIGRLGEHRIAVGGEATGGALGGDRGIPNAPRSSWRQATVAKIFLTVVAPPLRVRGRTSPDDDCTGPPAPATARPPTPAGCAQHLRRSSRPSRTSRRISASLDRHDRHRIGAISSVQVRSAARYHVGRAPTMSRLLSVD